jgi:hypothetical protein
MRKPYFFLGLGFLALIIAPLIKAQSSGLCIVTYSTSASCRCGGVSHSVPVTTCGIETSKTHCYSGGSVQCCAYPLIRFETYSSGDPCGGPKIPVALQGLGEGQVVYMRNCRGLYVAGVQSQKSLKTKSHGGTVTGD